ncbi:hypothetical protein [Methanomethylovorans sp.]|uniref:hypothetical protein n=1 Tax=Methanomethylovorans sp. TaxID=2758717 RepID=UPI00345E6F12
MYDLDFTMDKYEIICQNLLKAKLTSSTVKDFLLKKNKSRIVILRHDVDKDPNLALKMAKIEYLYGIRSTYYFRYKRGVFDSNIIKNISNMGHEIGYHYEVLDKAKGDYFLAMEIFKEELKCLRNIAEVSTICMHGNPLTPWVNKDIWKKYNFEDFGILGEAYLSLNFNDIYYFTDTGRSWNSSKYSVKDIIDNYPIHKINSTDDLIDFMYKTDKNMCILVHPNRWKDKLISWYIELIYQNIKNIGKLILNYRKH